MIFSEYSYERPDIDGFREQVRAAMARVSAAVTPAEVKVELDSFHQAYNEIETLQQLAMIRSDINSKDLFYEGERNFFDEATPEIMQLRSEFSKLVLDKPFRSELETLLGKQYFRLKELEQEVMDEKIIPDLQEENKLATRYDKLLASAQISFDGKILTLAQLDPYTKNPERSIRKAAIEAKFSFFEQHEEEIDEIYSALVQVRDRIAKKMGFQNYVAFAYKSLGRSDYGAEEVAAYREQVRKSLLPLTLQLRKRQQARLGLDHLYFYDEGLNFNSGNAKPEGTAEEILAAARQMYHEMSPETEEFFDFMSEHEHFDLLAKEGKSGGGYCTMLPSYKAPFIFANFNGSSDDVDVLTHEAGHAFQMYMSRNFELPEYYMSTYEAAEIHSMSMEFFAWPWMEKFFGRASEKYKFAHLSESLLFVPYGVTVDHFQTWVYENPEATQDERKAKWRELERIYLPSRDYGDNTFLGKGSYWMRQSHIFTAPFYYIDYTLAQVCAFQFWQRVQEDRSQAWQAYLRLCRAGGSKSFLELLELAALKNPFKEGSIASITPALEVYLNSVKDDNM